MYAFFDGRRQYQCIMTTLIHYSQWTNIVKLPGKRITDYLTCKKRVFIYVWSLCDSWGPNAKGPRHQALQVFAAVRWQTTAHSLLHLHLLAQKKMVAHSPSLQSLSLVKEARQPQRFTGFTSSLRIPSLKLHVSLRLLFVHGSMCCLMHRGGAQWK